MARQTPIRRGVKVNGEWLTRELGRRGWSASAFEEACADNKTPVSRATISVGLKSGSVDPEMLANMVATLRARKPTIPDEALA